MAVFANAARLRSLCGARSGPPRLARFCSTAQVAPARGRITDLSGLGPKRFYKEVDVRFDHLSQHYTVLLDGKRVRTPNGTVLSAPTEALATVIGAEWDAQTSRIRPSSMPVTTLVSTALDVVPDFRPRIASSILRFLDTDTVCIRPSQPASLVQRQAALFDPITAHLDREHRLSLNVSIGGLVAKQSAAVRAHVTRTVDGMDDLSLAAMDSAASTAKSISISLALRDGAIGADAAADAARSEEGWQEGVWGTVEGGHDLDAADVLVRLSAADMVFRLIRAAPECFVRSTPPGGVGRRGERA